MTSTALIEIDFCASIVQQVSFAGTDFFVKRDDLVHPQFNGNKARKFYFYLQKSFDGIKNIVSVGSSQSNAMFALSLLAKEKQWNFFYGANHVCDVLKRNPDGNLKAALQNGMQLVSKEDAQKISQEKTTLYIPEGGAIHFSQFGIELLAKELTQWIAQHQYHNPKIFLPSGTGTTAFYLQKYLPYEVVTVACIGSAEGLAAQLQSFKDEDAVMPTILEPEKRLYFGKLRVENFHFWKKVCEDTQIQFDLLYDPIGIQSMLTYKKNHPNTTIIYLHQGGILGNETMIARYERKLFMI